MTVSELERAAKLVREWRDATNKDVEDTILALISEHRLVVSALQEIASHGEHPGDTIEIRLARANLSWNTAVRTLENLKVKP